MQHLEQIVVLGAETSDIATIRNCLAISVAFLLFLRSNTVAAVTHSDVQLTPDSFIVSSTVIKGLAQGVNTIPNWEFFKSFETVVSSTLRRCPISACVHPSCDSLHDEELPHDELVYNQRHEQH
jgi:hypothetical protein